MFQLSYSPEQNFTMQLRLATVTMRHWYYWGKLTCEWYHIKLRRRHTLTQISSGYHGTIQYFSQYNCATTSRFHWWEDFYQQPVAAGLKNNELSLFSSIINLDTKQFLNNINGGQDLQDFIEINKLW